MRTAADIETEIGQLKEALDYFYDSKNGLDIALRPYWEKRDDLNWRINRTFPKDQTGRIKFSFKDAAERKEHYAALLALAEEYSDLNSQRSDTVDDIKAAEREHKWLRQQLEYMEKKGLLVI
jgi:hypothetical protein